MSGIFLSYRRADSSGWAGRLYEYLVRGWGSEHVFIDIDAIAPGEDFREAIARTMRTCDVVLVVIGPSWLNARDEAGNRRLDDEADTHRREVTSALAADVRIVPVLVGGATMPKLADLPEPLQDLVYRNAAIIEDRRFASDASALQDALKRYAEQLAAERHGTARAAEQATAHRTAREAAHRESEQTTRKDVLRRLAELLATRRADLEAREAAEQQTARPAEPTPSPIADLLSFSDAIDSPHLSPDRQRLITAGLHARLESLTDDAEQSDVVDLLRRLRSRPDLLYSVAAEIDRVLASPWDAAKGPALDQPRDTEDVMAEKAGRSTAQAKRDRSAPIPSASILPSAQSPASGESGEVFEKVWYLSTRPEGKARELVTRRTGQLEIGSTAATFTSKSGRMVLTDIQQVQFITVKRLNQWIHVTYGDCGDTMSAYFSDAGSLGWRGLLGGNKRIHELLKALEH